MQLHVCGHSFFPGGAPEPVLSGVPPVVGGVAGGTGIKALAMSPSSYLLHVNHGSGGGNNKENAANVMQKRESGEKALFCVVPHTYSSTAGALSANHATTCSRG